MSYQVIPNWDQFPDLSWKDKIAYLTCEFLKLPQTECPVEHVTGHGTYMRVMRIPADTLFIGRAHRHGHECSLRSGSVIYITESGRKTVHAPFTVHTTPGTHMVLYTLTDIIGHTVHPNKHNSIDFEAMENEIFESVESLKELGALVHQKLEAPCLA